MACTFSQVKADKFCTTALRILKNSQVFSLRKQVMSAIDRLPGSSHPNAVTKSPASANLPHTSNQFTLGQIESEVTYARGMATRYLPGISLVGKGQIEIKRQPPAGKKDFPADKSAPAPRQSAAPQPLLSRAIINQAINLQNSSDGQL
jgi:hypothetical protein